MSETQRSVFNIKRLTSRPIWTLEQTTYKDFFELVFCPRIFILKPVRTLYNNFLYYLVPFSIVIMRLV